MREWGLAAYGANCGNGPDEIERVIYRMHQFDPHAVLIAKANAGIPQWVNNLLTYDGTPALMGECSLRLRALGARMIGGCCGNTPLHVMAMHAALQTPENEFDADAVIAEMVEIDEAEKAKTKTKKSAITPHQKLSLA